MSVNFNRAKYNKAKSRKEYRNLLLDDLYPLYWDECITFYGKIMSYQKRMYRTWKHNRKTQWKD